MSVFHKLKDGSALQKKERIAGDRSTIASFGRCA